MSLIECLNVKIFNDQFLRNFELNQCLILLKKRKPFGSEEVLLDKKAKESAEKEKLDSLQWPLSKTLMKIIFG